MNASRKIILIIVIIVVAVWIVSILKSSSGKPGNDTVTISDDTVIFSEKIQDYVIENIGQPIEGFNAEIYLQTFPGLFQADFDGVETLEGKYKYKNGELAFERNNSQIISSAEEAISEAGHQTLFENVRGRLDINLSADEVVNNIVAEGLGKIIGTIFIGPTCGGPLKTPSDPECSDKPIQGEFSVKNTMGNVEFTRFVTDEEGNFSVTLPTGEYYITWADPVGIPAEQGHLVNIESGKTIEVDITFDTGIR